MARFIRPFFAQSFDKPSCIGNQRDSTYFPIFSSSFHVAANYNFAFLEIDVIPGNIRGF